jgi:hypothetical protein
MPPPDLNIGALLGDAFRASGLAIPHVAAERVNDFETPFVMRLASKRV